MQPDSSTLLQVMGLHPVVVENLEDDAVVLWDHGIILLRAGIEPADLLDVLDQTLTLCVAELASTAGGSGVGSP